MRAGGRPRGSGPAGPVKASSRNRYIRVENMGTYEDAPMQAPMGTDPRHTHMDVIGRPCVTN